MTISKHIHSCLLIKDAGKTILIDPGNYSVESGAINIEKIDRLDYLLVTHEHPDHLDIPFVKQLLIKFPQVTFISNKAVQTLLAREQISCATDGDDFISVSNAPHEHVFGAPQFENVLFTINAQLTHPGDSIHFDKSARVLALPVQAPWGNPTEAVEKAVSLHPEIVIPIHDWHWNDQARQALFERMEGFFTKQNIKFLALESGVEVEV